MSDEQDRAESLDDDVIAVVTNTECELLIDDGDEDAIPEKGAERFEQIAALDEEYPPDQPIGAEDPGRFEIEDDVSERDARRSDGDER